jgi:hypothetical protein
MFAQASNKKPPLLPQRGFFTHLFTLRGHAASSESYHYPTEGATKATSVAAVEAKSRGKL